VIAALMAGLIVLIYAEPFRPESVLWELWLAQSASAWLGPLAIDEALKRLPGRSNGI